MSLHHQTKPAPAQDERAFNPEHTLFNEIRNSTPVNEEGEETRYIINEQQLLRIRALECTRPAQTNLEQSGLVEALEAIVRQYPNPDISHVDYRVHACRQAEQALDAYRAALPNQRGGA